MEDVLELDVEDNEFDHEPTKSGQTLKDCAELGGKICEVSKPKLAIPPDTDDAMKLYEAKKKLLERLSQLEEDVESNFNPKTSVKSRLGVRETVEDVEFMDCSEPCDFPGSLDDKNVRSRLRGSDEQLDVIQRTGGHYASMLMTSLCRYFPYDLVAVVTNLWNNPTMKFQFGLLKLGTVDPSVQ